MLSPRETYSRTCLSISSGPASLSIREWITIVLVRARGGKSHSWLTPTISRSKPRAKRTSVAEGNKETTLMRGIYHKAWGEATNGFPRTTITRFSYLYRRYLRLIVSYADKSAFHPSTILSGAT